MATIHLRNGHAPQPTTWCGKKLLGAPAVDDAGTETFSSYGSDIAATYIEDVATCGRCKEVFDAAYASAFPNEPEPIATFRLDVPEDVERARSILGADNLRRVFGPDGGGMAEFDRQLRDDDNRLVCPVGDPDCLGDDGECHDACEPL